MLHGRVKLIINADDLGLSPEVNDQILTALADGTCTSASVLGHAPGTAALAGQLGRFPAVSFGVHLNLTEFAPLTGVPLLQPLLVDGRFCERSLEVTRRQADSVYDEWCAQVLAVRDLGVRLSHFDSHQHVHYHPVLFRVLKRVQARFGIARVRGMASWRPGGGAGALVQIVRAGRFARAIRMDTPESVTTDGFGSVRVFRELLEAGLLHGDSFEIMCHPGNPHDTAAYEAEMAWLRSDWRAGRPELTLHSWWGVP